ncbi:MAG: TetR family transcriptional regulator [Ruminococcus sp.]
MIKKTFYNLPEEKRQRIISAVMNEFSSSATEKVSINRIIKAANISRGSFYQYFDDKVDLVEVLVKTFADVSVESGRKALEYSNGDIFYTYEKLFDTIADFGNDKKQKLLLKNLMKNLRANDDLISEYMLNRFEGLAPFRDFSNQFNRANLKYKSDEDVQCLSQILTQVLKNSIFDVFVVGMDSDKVRKNYLRKLEIIKSGAVIDYN